MRLDTLLLIGATGLSAAPGRQTPPDLQLTTEHYVLDVTLDFERERLSGTAALTVRNFSDRPASSVPLTLYRLMDVTSAKDAAGRTLPFDEDVVRFVDFDELQVTAVHVRLPEALPPGGTTTITVGTRTGKTMVLPDPAGRPSAGRRRPRPRAPGVARRGPGRGLAARRADRSSDPLRTEGRRRRLASRQVGRPVSSRGDVCRTCATGVGRKRPASSHPVVAGTARRCGHI